jgi:peptide-methionine (S)-S-oxide reductase
MEREMSQETKKAIFAAGCFWQVEAAFGEVDGVIDTIVGYSGGHVPNPTYEMVCSDRTGHAESVQVTYDPAKISYQELLETFWKIHDPTTLNRQGPDIGSQYRSAIFYLDEEQKAAALASKDRLEKSGRFRRPIVTEITAAGPFYRAEEYHQKYLNRGTRAHF